MFTNTPLGFLTVALSLGNPAGIIPQDLSFHELQQVLVRLIVTVDQTQVVGLGGSCAVKSRAEGPCSQARVKALPLCPFHQH